MDEEPNVSLVFVVDCNQLALQAAASAHSTSQSSSKHQNGISNGFVSEEPVNTSPTSPVYVPDLLDVVLTLVKTFVALSATANITVVATYPSSEENSSSAGAAILYPDVETEGFGSAFGSLKYPRLERKFRKSVKEVGAKISSNLETIKRYYGLSKGLSVAVSRLNKMINQQKARLSGTEAVQNRIILLQATNYDPDCFVQVINAAFAAQKLEIVIDAVDLTSDSARTSSPCILLQKICGLTNGLCYNPFALQTNSNSNEPKTFGKEMLLHMLFNYFLPDLHLREKFLLPENLVAKKNDYNKTICFCHNRLVNRGFVCSVCLAVFCEKQKKCPTCDTDVLEV